MTYGWAILVVLAAIAALAYFGVLSPDKFLPNKCTISGGFSCSEYKVDSATTNVLINVQNNLGVDADYVNVSLDSSDCALQGSPAGTPADPLVVNSGTIPALENGDKSGLLTFDCTSLPSKFNGEITVTYVRAGETVSHTASGSITGQAE